MNKYLSFSKIFLSFNEERRTDPNVSNGELDPEDFGEWWNFANCLKSAMLLIEGQAYFKVIMIKVLL